MKYIHQVSYFDIFKHKKIWLPCSCLALTLFLSACTINPKKEADEEALEKARQQYHSKHYEDAAITLLPLAREGNPDAQYSLGYMYYYGLGVPKNVNYGRQLIQASAAQNNERAIEAISTFSEQLATLGPSPERSTAPGSELTVNPDHRGKPPFFLPTD